MPSDYGLSHIIILAFGHRIVNVVLLIWIKLHLLMVKSAKYSLCLPSSHSLFFPANRTLLLFGHQCVYPQTHSLWVKYKEMSPVEGLLGKTRGQSEAKRRSQVLSSLMQTLLCRYVRLRSAGSISWPRGEMSLTYRDWQTRKLLKNLVLIYLMVRAHTHTHK